MNRIHLTAGMVALVASACLAPREASAVERGLTDAGIAYASGGIGIEERRQLHSEKNRYSLWVATVAKGSGAYLASARVRVTSLDGAVIIDRAMDGPWFFAALPPGRYEVSASVPASTSTTRQTLKSRVLIGAGDQRQAVLRFTSTSEVGPERPHPFDGNPFADATAER